MMNMYVKLARMVGYVRSHVCVHVCFELNVVQVQVHVQVLVCKVHELTDNYPPFEKGLDPRPKR